MENKTKSLTTTIRQIIHPKNQINKTYNELINELEKAVEQKYSELQGDTRRGVKLIKI